MTVAAVILSATAEGALAETRGQPRVRRLADIAWSGGALPTVVVSADPDGAVSRALAGSEAVHEDPAPVSDGPKGQMLRGAQRAQSEVRDTTAVLVWPARMAWVGPETITSLIETHGIAPGAVLRPTWHGEPGWPVLVPTAHFDALGATGSDRMPNDVIADLISTVPSRDVEMGDPGVTHDASVLPDALPPYEGPPEPPGGHRHEWGDDVAAAAGFEDRG